MPPQISIFPVVNFMLKKKEYDSAIKDFSKAIDMDELLLEPYIERAEAYFAIGNIYQCKKDLENVFKGIIPDLHKGSYYNPLWKRVYTLRAKIAEDEGDYTNAEADYSIAEKL